MSRSYVGDVIFELPSAPSTTGSLNSVKSRSFSRNQGLNIITPLSRNLLHAAREDRGDDLSTDSFNSIQITCYT